MYVFSILQSHSPLELVSVDTASWSLLLLLTPMPFLPLFPQGLPLYFRLFCFFPFKLPVCWMSQVRETMEHFPFCVWPVSFSITTSRFIYFSTNDFLVLSKLAGWKTIWLHSYSTECQLIQQCTTHIRRAQVSHTDLRVPVGVFSERMHYDKVSKGRYTAYTHVVKQHVSVYPKSHCHGTHWTPPSYFKNLCSLQ